MLAQKIGPGLQFSLSNNIPPREEKNKTEIKAEFWGIVWHQQSQQDFKIRCEMKSSLWQVNKEVLNFSETVLFRVTIALIYYLI